MNAMPISWTASSFNALLIFPMKWSCSRWWINEKTDKWLLLSYSYDQCSSVLFSSVIYSIYMYNRRQSKRRQIHSELVINQYRLYIYTNDFKEHVEKCLKLFQLFVVCFLSVSLFQICGIDEWRDRKRSRPTSLKSRKPNNDIGSIQRRDERESKTKYYNHVE